VLGAVLVRLQFGLVVYGCANNMTQVLWTFRNQGTNGVALYDVVGDETQILVFTTTKVAADCDGWRFSNGWWAIVTDGELITTQTPQVVALDPASRGMDVRVTDEGLLLYFGLLPNAIPLRVYGWRTLSAGFGDLRFRTDALLSDCLPAKDAL
jgi:hypothetical protein